MMCAGFGKIEEAVIDVVSLYLMNYEIEVYVMRTGSHHIHIRTAETARNLHLDEP